MPWPPSLKCVGAFLRPCDNITTTILCSDCYRVVELEMNPTKRRGDPLRFSPRKRNGVEVAHGTRR